MSQHDYVLADQAGAAFLADSNAALAAIVSNNSGTAEPATTYPYQWWADTTTGLLKIRDSANSAWITVGTLASANLGLLSALEIGASIQAYDAATAKLNIAQAFTKVQSCNTGTASVSTTSSFTFDPSTHGQDCEITLTNAITVTLAAAAGKIVAGTYYTLTFKAGDTSARAFAKGATVLAPAATLPIVAGSVTSGGRDVFHLRGVDADTVMVVGSSADVR